MKKYNYETRSDLAERISEAKATLSTIFKPGSPDYYIKDSELTAKLDLSAPTARRLRNDMGIPCRDERIMAKVASMGVRYLDEYLAQMPGVTYHGLYMLMQARGFQFLRRNK